MKSNFTLFNTLLLAAPLALCLTVPALAQAEQGTITPAPAQDTNSTPSPLRDNVEFLFPGGTPGDFLNAVEKQYKVDWKKVADIPRNMEFVHIPALRMNWQSSERILGPTNNFPFGGGGGRRGGGPEDRNPLNALISLYNTLGRAKPELGHLMVEGDLQKPSVVIFHSTNSSAGFSGFTSSSDRIPFQMKAFALNGIPTNEWNDLKMGFLIDLDEFAQKHGSGDLLNGVQVNLHEKTGLLVVFGPDFILQAAESVVTAWRENHKLATPGTALPSVSK